MPLTIPLTVSLKDSPCFSAGFQIKYLTSVQALPLHECSGKLGNIAASDVWCLACACQFRNDIRNRPSHVSERTSNAPVTHCTLQTPFTLSGQAHECFVSVPIFYVSVAQMIWLISQRLQHHVCQWLDTA